MVGGYNSSSAGLFGIGKITSVMCSVGTSLLSGEVEVSEVVVACLTVG